MCGYYSCKFSIAKVIISYTVLTMHTALCTKFSMHRCTCTACTACTCIQGRPARRGHLVTRITVTLSIFNFSTRFFAQIVENRETQLSSPFLGPGDNFSKSYDENQIWCAPARAPRERPWRVQSPRSCIRSHARGLARVHSDQMWFSS